MALPRGRERVYLADGVYATFDRDRGIVRLTAENGVTVQHEIVMDDTTLLAFLTELQRRKIIKWQPFPEGEK